MTDKELNTAILNELYRVADEVWASMKKGVVGSFTAREIYSKHLYRDMFFSTDQSHHVEVGNFRCSFQSKQIFDLVEWFEGLAGVGSRRRLFVAENKGKAECSVTFAVTRELEELCDFTEADNIRPAYAFIFIDADRKCLVATNGCSMKVCPVSIHSKKGDTSEMRILAADFKKMCAKMKGKNVYEMTATKERTDDDICTNIMFEGIAASASHEYTLPEWYSVFTDRSSELSFNVQNWKAVNKVAKMGKYELIQVSGKRGEKTVQFLAGKCEAQVEVGKELKHSFCLLFGAKQFAIIKKAESICFYFGTEDSKYVEAVDNNGNVYIFCQKVKEDSTTFVGEHVDDVLVAPDVECDINVLSRYVMNAKRTTKAASRKASKARNTVAKKALKTTAAKQVVHSRKFTFAAIGVHPGYKLTFVDGKEVVVVDDNKVSFEGSTYTLSGFCKTFMPDEKRNKSNSYRGCVFFYRDGVKLEKLFNEALAANEQHTDAVANGTHEETETAEIHQEDVCTETKMEDQVVNVCAGNDIGKQTLNVCAEENHAEKLQEDVCEETKTEDQVVNVCAEENHAERPHADGCTETKTEEPGVNACAEENHSEKPCFVRPVPLNVLQSINYPLLIFGRRGAAFHTNVRKVHAQEGSGRLNERNVPTFSLSPPIQCQCHIQPLRPGASRPCALHSCTLRQREPRVPASSPTCAIRTFTPASGEALRPCAHVSLAALRLDHHVRAPPAPPLPTLQTFDWELRAPRPVASPLLSMGHSMEYP